MARQQTQPRIHVHYILSSAFHILFFSSLHQSSSEQNNHIIYGWRSGKIVMASSLAVAVTEFERKDIPTFANTCLMDKQLVKKFKEIGTDERKKLLEVLKESANSEPSKKIEWIYKEHNVDNEEYLLGRRIDKAITHELEAPQSENAPGALFNEIIARRSQQDMQLKMKEDPLYIIRLKEEEAKKRILENPLKMKKLQAMINTKSTEKEVKKKVKKKKKKRKRGGSSESSSEGEELLARYMAVLRQKKMTVTSKRHCKRNDDDGCSEGDDAARYAGDRAAAMNKKKRKSCDDDGDEDDEVSHKRKKHKGKQHEKLTKLKKHYDSGDRNKKHKKKRHRDDHDDDDDSDVDTDEEARRKQKERNNRFGLEVKLDNIDSRTTSNKVDYSIIDLKKKGIPPPVRNKVKRKMTEEEKEEMRKQMMLNAKERDEERVSNVKRYREEDSKEDANDVEDDDNKDGLKKKRFIEPLMMMMASTGSVENSIKRNMHTVQRSHGDYHSSFLKRS
ncbi:hypothetical protein HELRODRAFT_188581 [Helobdella robusta]|uniref:Uncharacterized protein n=1 Tax=Helobdella robusta TaxID=6412 RepID=T1FQ54_HELRO|nr:hypothetical protein HELRODRAFT_188581 [Helobdella robusta]ESO02120.1 hypothetical protein HELRODRAFT_188581 [Helobdella robusta]